MTFTDSKPFLEGRLVGVHGVHHCDCRSGVSILRQQRRRHMGDDGWRRPYLCAFGTHDISLPPLGCLSLLTLRVGVSRNCRPLRQARCQILLYTAPSRWRRVGRSSTTCGMREVMILTSALPGPGKRMYMSWRDTIITIIDTPLSLSWNEGQLKSARSGTTKGIEPMR